MAHPQCCTFAPILNPSYGAGQVEEFGGITTYTSGSSDSKRAILLIADVFGYSAPNLRNLAHKCAAAGYFVVAPDFLHGDPFDHSGDRTFVEWVNDHPVEIRLDKPSNGSIHEKIGVQECLEQFGKVELVCNNQEAPGAHGNAPGCKGVRLRRIDAA